MDEKTIGNMVARIFQKICAVCPDRNVDGPCNLLAEGRCTLLVKLPAAAVEAISSVSSDRIDPYIEAIRNEVCGRCNLRNPDGTCAPRDIDNCMLWSYLPLVVEGIKREMPSLRRS